MSDGADHTNSAQTKDPRQVPPQKPMTDRAAILPPTLKARTENKVPVKRAANTIRPAVTPSIPGPSVTSRTSVTTFANPIRAPDPHHQTQGDQKSPTG